VCAGHRDVSLVSAEVLFMGMSHVCPDCIELDEMEEYSSTIAQLLMVSSSCFHCMRIGFLESNFGVKRCSGCGASCAGTLKHSSWVSAGHRGVKRGAVHV
jgi:hypothetical protein